MIFEDPTKDLSQDPVKLWTDIQKEVLAYREERAKLGQVRKEHRKIVEGHKKEKLKSEKRGKHLEQFSKELSKEELINRLQTLRDTLANRLVEKSAIFDMTEKEKELVKEIAFQHWKADLLCLLYEERKCKKKILKLNRSEWKYILTHETSFEDLNNLLTKLLKLKQKKNKLLLDYRQQKKNKLLLESRQSGKKSYIKGPTLLVDMRPFLCHPTLESNRASDAIPTKPAKHKLKAKARTKVIEPKTYKEYLEMLDKDIHYSFSMYQKHMDEKKNAKKIN